MRKWLIGLSLVFLILLWQVGQLTYHVVSEKNKWEELGIQLAKEYTAIEHITNVTLFHGSQSYIVVEGTNPAGVQMVAWFREEGIFERYEYVKDLVSVDQVKEKVKRDVPRAEFVRLQPGMENRAPLWEVVVRDSVGKFGYYYYDMKSGEFLRSYRLQRVEG